MGMLTEMGYKEYENLMSKTFAVDNTFYKRVNNPLVECEENGDKISFHCVEYAVTSNLPPQYEFTLTFRKNGVWWNLKAYSISKEELTKEKMLEIERNLVNMFLTIK